MISKSIAITLTVLMLCTALAGCGAKKRDSVVMGDLARR